MAYCWNVQESGAKSLSVQRSHHIFQKLPLAPWRWPPSVTGSITSQESVGIPADCCCTLCFSVHGDQLRMKPVVMDGCRRWTQMCLVQYIDLYLCELFRSNVACHYCDACGFQGYRLIVMERPSAIRLTHSSFTSRNKKFIYIVFLKSVYSRRRHFSLLCLLLEIWPKQFSFWRC